MLAQLHADAATACSPAGSVSAQPYRLRIHWPDAVQETEDPYAFGPVLGDMDLHLFSEGTHWELAERFGVGRHDASTASTGVRFAVWAPNARRVSVVGDFNTWDGRRHPMRLRHDAGVWEMFMPRLDAGERYKYEIVGAGRRRAAAESRSAGARHRTAAGHRLGRAPQPSTFAGATPTGWQRAPTRRRRRADLHLEVHAASWLRPEDDQTARSTGIALAERLIPYVDGSRLHPYRADADHGASVRRLLGLSAAVAIRAQRPLRQRRTTSRISSIAAIAPASASSSTGCRRTFPTDAHGLARFDGTALYEHADPREGFHHDWNTCIYNLGRREVQGFLIASAL